MCSPISATARSVAGAGLLPVDFRRCRACELGSSPPEGVPVHTRASPATVGPGYLTSVLGFPVTGILLRRSPWRRRCRRLPASPSYSAPRREQGNRIDRFDLSQLNTYSVEYVFHQVKASFRKYATSPGPNQLCCGRPLGKQ